MIINTVLWNYGEIKSRQNRGCIIRLENHKILLRGSLDPLQFYLSISCERMTSNKAFSRYLDYQPDNLNAFSFNL
jgi:hypothetical protein